MRRSRAIRSRSATMRAGTVTPWYQRPDRPVPPPPAATPQNPPATQKHTDTAARRRLTRRLVIGAGTVAVLIAAAVPLSSVSKLGATGGKVLDVTKVQVGVLQTLSDPASGYGANKGTTFTCDAIVNGAQRHVTVVVSDDNRTYEIDGPDSNCRVYCETAIQFVPRALESDQAM